MCSITYLFIICSFTPSQSCPPILFEYISNVCNCGPPRFEGSVPENELLDMSKMEIFLGSRGIGPLSRLELMFSSTKAMSARFAGKLPLN